MKKSYKLVLYILSLVLLLVVASCSNEKNENSIPWEEGGKPPIEYTWEEFEALSGPLQIIFQDSFETENGFDDWLAKNEP